MVIAETVTSSTGLSTATTTNQMSANENQFGPSELQSNEWDITLESLSHRSKHFEYSLHLTQRMATALAKKNFVRAQVLYNTRTEQGHPGRESLKREVNDLLEQAGTGNWDGEDALAIQKETIVIAIELIDQLPSYLDIPDVAPTPHGEVDFDWVIDRDLMLTVSVGPLKEIAFSGLFNGARLNGSEPWTGVLPQFVNCCFERLRDARQA